MSQQKMVDCLRKIRECVDSAEKAASAPFYDTDVIRVLLHDMAGHMQLARLLVDRKPKGST